MLILDWHSLAARQLKVLKPYDKFMVGIWQSWLSLFWLTNNKRANTRLLLCHKTHRKARLLRGLPDNLNFGCNQASDNCSMVTVSMSSDKLLCDQFSPILKMETYLYLLPYILFSKAFGSSLVILDWKNVQVLPWENLCNLAKFSVLQYAMIACPLQKTCSFSGD